MDESVHWFLHHSLGWWVGRQLSSWSIHHMQHPTKLTFLPLLRLKVKHSPQRKYKDHGDRVWVFKNKYFHIFTAAALLLRWAASVVGGWNHHHPWSSSRIHRTDRLTGFVEQIFHPGNVGKESNRAIEFTICCDIFTIMGRRLHYIKYNKIRHKNNGFSRFINTDSSPLNKYTLQLHHATSSSEQPGRQPDTNRQSESIYKMILLNRPLVTYMRLHIHEVEEMKGK